MYVKNLKDCEEFISRDGAILRELLHADKGTFAFRYSLAHAKIKPGVKTQPHKLKTSEVYYILSGKGRMFIDKETREVGPGDAIDIPPLAVQCIENTGREDLDFICIVDPAWRLEDEDILEKA